MKLKWNRVWRLFLVYIIWSCLYSVFLNIFVLHKFSFLQGNFRYKDILQKLSKWQVVSKLGCSVF